MGHHLGPGWPSKHPCLFVVVVLFFQWSPYGDRKRKNMHYYILISKKKLRGLTWFIINSVVNTIGSAFLRGRGGGGRLEA